MRKKPKTTAVLIYIGLLIFAKIASASTWLLDGKTPVTKGEATMALIKDPKRLVIKQDQVYFDTETGTIKNVKKGKK